MALILIFYMCAVMLNGTSNCDEQWKVAIFSDLDVRDQCRVDDEVGMVRGCSFWDRDKGIGYGMILSANGTSRDKYFESTILHEMYHLACLCHWHDKPPQLPAR